VLNESEARSVPCSRLASMCLLRHIQVMTNLTRTTSTLEPCQLSLHPVSAETFPSIKHPPSCERISLSERPARRQGQP
jgi:hypothetical protein